MSSLVIQGRADQQPPAGYSAPKHVARGGIIAFAVYAGGAGLTYCAQLLVARSIGAEGYGIYAYVFAWITMLGYGAALGFDVSILRFVPAYRAQGRRALSNGVIVFAERSALVCAGCIVLVGALLISLTARTLAPVLTTTFLIGLLLVPLWALLWIRCSVVRAFGGVLSAIAPDRIVRDGMLVLIIGAAALAPALPLGAPSAMAATVISSAVALATVTLAKHRRHGATLNQARPAYAARTWLTAALPLVVLGVAEVGINRIGVVLLGWTGHTTEAGVYALAFSIAFLTVLPRTAVNALFAPAISDLFARGDTEGLRRLAAKAALWTLLGAACIALPLALMAETVLAWFGPGFATGVMSLRVLLLGQVVVAGAGSQLYLLTMTGHERGAAVLMLGSAAASLVGGAYLVTYFGLTGAAIGGTLTLLLLNAAMAVLVRGRLLFWPGPFTALFPSAVESQKCAAPGVGAGS